LTDHEGDQSSDEVHLRMKLCDCLYCSPARRKLSASLYVPWSPLWWWDGPSRMTVLLNLCLIFPSLNSRGKERELTTEVSSRRQAICFPPGQGGELSCQK